MIIVDTSVWLDHLCTGDTHLAALLNGVQVYMHPFVLGELACSNLSDRKHVLALLKGLPSATVASPDEALYAIEENTLLGKGIGYVDAHLLASAKLSSDTRLWTRDNRLHQLALSLKLAYEVT
jgi:predicted nucleic acid-binding protein